MAKDTVGVSEIFKAIGDPIRWQIIEQIADREQYPCAELEEVLPVSKPTISYHVKILTQVGLVEVSKRGRNYYYTLHRQALEQMIDELRALLPGLHLVGENAPTGRRGGGPTPRRGTTRPGGRTGLDPQAPLADGTGGRLLTW